MNKLLIILFLFFVTTTSAQDTTIYHFQGWEIQKLYKYVDSLEQLSSLQDLKINELQFQIFQYKEKDLRFQFLYGLEQEENQYLRAQNETYKNIIKDVSPKWWEKKGVWFTFGFLSSTLVHYGVSKLP